MTTRTRKAHSTSSHGEHALALRRGAGRLMRDFGSLIGNMLLGVGVSAAALIAARAIGMFIAL